MNATKIKKQFVVQAPICIDVYCKRIGAMFFLLHSASSNGTVSPISSQVLKFEFFSLILHDFGSGRATETTKLNNVPGFIWTNN